MLNNKGDYRQKCQWIFWLSYDEGEEPIVDPWDMLNKCCFHVSAQNSLIIGEIGNVLVATHIARWHQRSLVSSGTNDIKAARHFGLLFKQ